MPKAIDREIVFLSGFVLITIGAALLCLTTGLVSDPLDLLPLSGVLVGGFMVFFDRQGRFQNARRFVGWLLILESVVVTVSLLAAWPFESWWPLLVFPFGIAAFVTGWRRHKRFKASYLAPALVFVGLTLTFLPFSFHAIQLSFREAFGMFWPALLVALGVALVGMYLYNKAVFGKSAKRRP